MTGQRCDRNVWLALTLPEHVHHGATRSWLDGVDTRASVLFCRATQRTFLRLLTDRAVLSPYGNPPLTSREAWEVYGALLADDRIIFRSDEPAQLGPRWEEFAVRDSASPKRWMDAYLAAFAVSGGHRLVTTDGAFRQFDGLDLVLIG